MPGGLDKYLTPKPDNEEKSFPLVQMILFRWKTGNCLAISYPHLIWMTYNPDGDLVMHFSTHTVKLSGINLSPLLQKLAAFALPEVVETSERYDETDGDATRVTGIEASQISEAAELLDLGLEEEPPTPGT